MVLEVKLAAAVPDDELTGTAEAVVSSELPEEVVIGFGTTVVPPEPDIVLWV